MLLVKAQYGNGGQNAPPDGWASKCRGSLGSPGNEKTVSRGRAKGGIPGTTTIWGAGGRREIHAEQREDLEPGKKYQMQPQRSVGKGKAWGLEAPGGR